MNLNQKKVKMAKKAPLKENEEEIEVIEEADEPEEVPVKAKTKEAINIMDPKDSAEPPKRKQKEDVPAVDLSPVLEAITKGFEGLAPKEIKKEEKDERGFFETLGDW